MSPLGRTSAHGGAWPQRKTPLRRSAWPRGAWPRGYPRRIVWESEWSQVGLAGWGGSDMSSRTGCVLLGGLATVGFGRHSTSDCHAARSSMHERGAHSSELAWRLATEYAHVPCLTRVCVRWCNSLWNMACAPGAVRPCCSRTTGTIPLFKPVEVEPLLSIGAAFGMLFSEKVATYWLVDVCGVDAHVDPDFRASRFYDMYVRSM